MAPGPTYAGAIGTARRRLLAGVLTAVSGDYSRTSLAHLAHETVRGLAHLLIHRTRLPRRSLSSFRARSSRASARCSCPPLNECVATPHQAWDSPPPLGKNTLCAIPMPRAPSLPPRPLCAGRVAPRDLTPGRRGLLAYVPARTCGAASPRGLTAHAPEPELDRPSLAHASHPCRAYCSTRRGLLVGALRAEYVARCCRHGASARAVAMAPARCRDAPREGAWCNGEGGGCGRGDGDSCGGDGQSSRAGHGRHAAASVE